jgi:hypothetical protein
MKANKSWKQLMIGCLLFALLTSCATLAPELSPTNIPSTATPETTSCEEVEGMCLELSFDGENCAYEGPTDLKPGLVTLIFLNESDGWAASNLIKLLGDKTLQDVIEYNGEEPSTKHAPSWSVDVPGVWKEINPGESHFWEGVLEPGIHALVCARSPPWPESIGVWLGTGITVGDG